MAKKARIRWDVNNEELEKSRKLLKEIQKQAGLTDKEVEEIGDSIEENTKKTSQLKSSFQGLKGLIAGLGLAAAITAAAKAFIELNEEIRKSRKEVALLTNLTGRELDRVTAKVRATSKTFDKEFNETLRAANTLSKEMDISLSEAIDNINEGFARGIDINGEYLDTIREYSTFAKQAGLDAKQLNILLQQQVTQGIFSDKGIDAVKEAVISIQEMTPATKDAITAIGLSADKITADIKRGAVTYFEVIQEIGQKTRELADPRITGQVLADIFRGAGEDAGKFALNLDSVGKEYNKLEGEALGYYTVQTNLIRAQEDFEVATVSLLSKMNLGWATLKTGILDAATAAIRFFGSHEDKVFFEFESTLNEWSKKTLPEVAMQFDKATEAVKEQEKIMQKYSGTVLKDAQKELEILKAEQDALNQILTKAYEEQDKLDDQVVKSTESLHEEAKAVRNVKIEIEDMNDEVQDLYEKMTALDENLIQRLLFGDPLTSEEEFYAKEEKILSDADRVYEALKEKHKKQKDERIQIDDDEARKRSEIQQGSFALAAELSGTLTGLKLSNLQREFDAAQGNDKKQRAIMLKMAQVEKQQAAFRTVINTAQGIISALALFPPNPILAAFIGATGAVQLSAILAQPLPKFAKGGMVGGKPHSQGGTIIEAEKGEFINRKESAQAYPELLKRANNLQLDKNVVDQILSGKSGGVTVVNSNKELIEAMNSKPDWQVMVDERGFTTRMRSKFGSYTQQRSRFSQ